MERETKRRRIIGGSGIEENTLAILDYYGSQDSQYSRDDRIAFLEAVRAASIVAENGAPPTRKMHEAIFQILRTEKSLELIMASFQLLTELEKCFPQVYSSVSGSSKPADGAQHELSVVNEGWFPFTLGSDNASAGIASGDENSRGQLDPVGFHVLIEDLTGLVNKMNFQAINIKQLRNMLLFQYLVNALEGDLLERISFYKENEDWTILREASVNLLLASRRINFKSLMRDCISILCGLHQIRGGCVNKPINQEISMKKSSNDHQMSLVTASLEIIENTFMSLQKFLVMIIELDLLRKQADMKGYTTRADGARTPLMDIIFDELTYNHEIIFPFFQVFCEPKWKLELIVQYLLKYLAKKPSVRTRRESGPEEEVTFVGVLKSLSNNSSLKSTVKKIGGEVVQLLVAHAFQAHLALASKSLSAKGAVNSEDVRSGSLQEICEYIIPTFESLRKVDEQMEILPIGKEALFAAATILSMESSGI